jgi:hypothetical protein
MAAWAVMGVGAAGEWAGLELSLADISMPATRARTLGANQVAPDGACERTPPMQSWHATEMACHRKLGWRSAGALQPGGTWQGLRLFKHVPCAGGGSTGSAAGAALGGLVGRCRWAQACSPCCHRFVDIHLDLSQLYPATCALPALLQSAVCCAAHAPSGKPGLCQWIRILLRRLTRWLASQGALLPVCGSSGGCSGCHSICAARGSLRLGHGRDTAQPAAPEAVQEA